MFRRARPSTALRRSQRWGLTPVETLRETYAVVAHAKAHSAVGIAGERHRNRCIWVPVCVRATLAERMLERVAGQLIEDQPTRHGDVYRERYGLHVERQPNRGRGSPVCAPEVV